MATQFVKPFLRSDDNHLRMIVRPRTPAAKGAIGDNVVFALQHQLHIKIAIHPRVTRDDFAIVVRILLRRAAFRSNHSPQRTNLLPRKLP
jgi:hypothetical protein